MTEDFIPDQSSDPETPHPVNTPSYQIRLPKPLYKNRPNHVSTRIEGYIDKGGMGTGFGIRTQPSPPQNPGYQFSQSCQ
jgi:hypothetical protein